VRLGRVGVSAASRGVFPRGGGEVTSAWTRMLSAGVAYRVLDRPASAVESSGTTMHGRVGCPDGASDPCPLAGTTPAGVLLPLVSISR